MGQVLFHFSGGDLAVGRVEEGLPSDNYAGDVVAKWCFVAFLVGRIEIRREMAK